MVKKDGQMPKKGMNRNVHPSELSQEEYSFAINANFQDEHGNGAIILQNEPSNIKCSGFQDGYKVIGHKFDINADRTYFFLTNPTTGCSEIGYIDSVTNLDGLEQIEEQCNCNIKVILEDPLENIIQESICSYTTLISDCEEECATCLNFSIDFPIKENNIQLKDEESGKVLYWTDNNNPQRYLKLDQLDIYTEDVDDCTGEITPTCLQCDLMRVFPLFDKPCLSVRTTQNGGNLRAGMYEFLIGYSTFEGEVISNYYSITNPYPVFDKNNNILDQTLLDYQTNQAVSIEVADLDDIYEYYTIVVIFRSGLDGAASYFKYGNYPINNTKVTIASLDDKERISLQDILVQKPFYTKAKGMSISNGYLFQYGLTAHREINLQPIVNLLGVFAKWNTIQAEEDLYEEGVNVVNFTGYMRDEVYPFSIKFFMDGGYETPIFPFIARPPKDSEIEELDAEGSTFTSNTNTQSILENAPECSDNIRNKRWQFENTATVDEEICLVETASYEVDEQVRTIELSCDTEVVDTIASGTLQIDTNLDIVTYINQNREEILLSSDPQWASIQAVLDDPTDYPEECEVEFGDNCSETVTLTDEEVLAFDTATESSEEVDADFDSYDRVTPPASCSGTKLDEFGDPEEDTTFETTYMRPGEVVYQKNPPLANSTCSAAFNTATFTSPSFAVSQYMLNKGSLSTFTPLQTSLPVTLTGSGFTNRIHTNAVWYKLDFAGREEAIIELSTILCDYSDDNSGSSVRVSLYDSCSAVIDVATYGVIVSDITLANDPDKFIQLDASDFSSDIAYIVIDSPIRSEADYEIDLEGASKVLTLTGTSGTANVIVAGNPYGATFNTNLSTTASDFVTAHAAAILAFDGTIVTSLGATLIFENDTSFPTLSITNTGGDLNGTIANATAKITIDAVDYPFTFNTTLTQTATDFVTNHAVAISAAHDIDISSTGEVISLRGDQTLLAGMTVTTLTGTLDGTPVEIESYHTLTPPCGCFSLYQRNVETVHEITFTDLTFIKRQTYSSECTFSVPILNGCNPVPYEHGDFSYWESLIKYPCNEELYNSQDLVINQDDLPAAYQTTFEDYYVDAVGGGGEYTLSSEADFRDRPIRHYKFPDSRIVPFISPEDQNPGKYKRSIIRPIGFRIDNEIINSFLDIAVNNGLLTLEERQKINKYEIFRGDRRTDKSIIAKGLLFDMYKYEDVMTEEDVYYPNYPLNTLGLDNFNEVQHPFSSTKNNQFTFHSPDTSFYKPTLPRELGIEGYQFGNSEIYFDEVKDHSTYVLLGDRAYQIATLLASAEFAFEMLLQVGDWTILAATGGISAPAALVLAAAFVVTLAAGVYKIGQYRYQWIQTFYNLGKGRNFAYYSAAVGFYNYFVSNPTIADTLRGIPSSTYLKSGKWTVENEVTGDSVDINNTDREDSVYIGLGSDTYSVNYPVNYTNYDNYDTNNTFASRRRYPLGIGRSPRLEGNAASPYVSLKQYLVEQYGGINSIEWVNTGYCGDLSSVTDCDPIFGGDTYISRFAVKRKLPFFTSNAHGLAPNIPFAYSEYFNINPIDPLTDVDTITRFFINYKMDTELDGFVAGFLFPSDRSKYNLDPGGNSINDFYIKPPNKFYLFSYGIPYFLVESTFNCNFRYAKREKHENFYPNIKDVIEWTQESNVTIKEPNTYFYNDVYSLSHTKSAWRQLPFNYNEEIYNRLTDLSNTVIYSRQDVSETSLVDPWLSYRALDAYQFPSSYGDLVEMDGIESEQVLARFTNGFAIFGAIDMLADRILPEQKNIGTGGIFAGRAISFNKTDLGYAGTQHTAKVSCEFGHIWADVKRGKVFLLEPNGQGLKDLTEGMEKWFKENLPFKIPKYYPTVDTDNNFKGIGISMGWDDRLKRVFLTKLDYIPISENICFNGTSFFRTDGYEEVIEEQENLGLTFEGIENCKLKFSDDEDVESFIDLTEIHPTNSDYFKDCSWTVAYSPLTQTWISYYSFKPNYYINYHDYFQTGLNFPEDENEFGLWSHLPFLSSYQVFYGKLYPFIVEYPLSTKMTNSQLHDISYWLDVRKYYNKYDFANIYNIGMNKAVVYNNSQNSGWLHLVPQEKNNLQQQMQYPKHNSDNIEILQTNLFDKWNFNYLYNLIRDEKAGLPIWIADCPQVDKTIDNRLLDYRPNFKDTLRGDYFLVRMIQDAESRYKMLFRFAIDDREYYDQ